MKGSSCKWTVQTDAHGIEQTPTGHGTLSLSSASAYKGLTTFRNNYLLGAPRAAILLCTAGQGVY